MRARTGDWLVIRSHLQPVTAGAGAMIGKRGVARTEVGQNGTVMVEGELWLAHTADGEVIIQPGRPVEVVAVDGLHLTVRPE